MRDEPGQRVVDDVGLVEGRHHHRHERREPSAHAATPRGVLRSGRVTRRGDACVVPHRHDAELAREEVEVGRDPSELHRGRDLHAREESQVRDLVTGQDVERVQQDRRLDPRHPAGPERAGEVAAGQRLGVLGQGEQVAHVDRHAQSRQRADRHLEHRRSVDRPAIRTQRPRAVAPAAVEVLALGALRRVELRPPEVDGAGDRADDRRQRARVVLVAPPHEARAGSARRGCSPGRGSRRGARRWSPTIASSAPLELLVELGLRVPVQPRLVTERVVADLVAGGGERGERVAVGGGVAPDQEERDEEVARREQVEDTRRHPAEVRGRALPVGLAPDHLVGPLVVRVERQARHRLHRADPTEASSQRCRSARPTVSFRFSVPFTIWADDTRCTPATPVAIGGTRSE